MFFYGKPSYACDIGYPPWANSSMGTVLCDGAKCYVLDATRVWQDGELVGIGNESLALLGIDVAVAQAARQNADTVQSPSGQYLWVTRPPAYPEETPARNSKLKIARRLHLAVRWVCYVSHQLSTFLCIYAAQASRDTRRQLPGEEPRVFTNNLRPINLWLLVINWCFLAIHALNSHYHFDGLAAEMSFWSPQLAMLLMVAIIIVMEIDSRGIIAGYKPSLYQGGVYLLRRYHGYIFSYFIIHQLWFHPWLACVSHVIGIAHSVLLLAQVNGVVTC